MPSLGRSSHSLDPSARVATTAEQQGMALLYKEGEIRDTDIWREGRFDAHCQQLLKFLP